MKALTLHQPWATLIALSLKQIETRSKPTSYRGSLAIHAAKQCRPVRYETYSLLTPSPGPTPELHLLDSSTHLLPLGAVVAICDLIAVVPTDLCVATELTDEPWHFDPALSDIALIDSSQLPFGDFTPGRYAWLLTNIQPLAPPLQITGYQGLWNFEPTN